MNSSRWLKPTEAELEILRVLWTRGPSTVRDVHAVLYGNDSGYTTALKLMQLMHAKGLLLRDDSARAHVYRPAMQKKQAQRRYVGELVARMFDGSSSRLVLEALGQQRASREELAEIRRLIERLEGEQES